MIRFRSTSRLRTALALALLMFLALLGSHLYRSASKDVARTADGALQPAITARAMPELNFLDASSTPRTIGDFRGKVVLLNIWATWCVPCRKEMPALDRLQQRLGGADFDVVALSIDNGGPAVVQRFYDEIGVRALQIYVDPASEVTTKLRTLGVPTTLLLDGDGQELWRKTGPAEWDAEYIVTLLRSRIAEPASSFNGRAPHNAQ